MKTDRELLELAAKAAGIELAYYDEDRKIWYRLNDDPSKLIQNFGYGSAIFDPLDNDGDALRLATRLCMSLGTGPCIATANTIEGALRGAFFKESTIGVAHDVAVRRVIVQAAAEIGEHMP